MYFVCIFSFFALNQCMMLVADRGHLGSGLLKVIKLWVLLHVNYNHRLWVTGP